MMNPAPTWGGSSPLRSQTSRVPTAGMTTKLAPSTENTVRRSRICAAKVRSGVRSPIESIDAIANAGTLMRSEEHTSELQSRGHLVCRLLLEKKKKITTLWTATSLSQQDLSA